MLSCCLRRWYLFKGDFIAICEALNLNHDVFAKRNRKGLNVGNFHRFFKKSFSISAEQHDTNDNFVPVVVASCYAWNSAPIDRIRILSSNLAID